MSDGTVRAKQPYEMPFAEFASAVRPSGAVNRLPQIGNSNAVVSYSIYMNGKVGASLPPATQEQVFDGAVLHTVTERLGLNPESYRDNLKVAELIAETRTMQERNAQLVQQLATITEYAHQLEQRLASSQVADGKQK